MAKLSRSEQVKRLEQKGQARVYKLRCITDGAVLEFVDEGPFEDNPHFRDLPPSGGRQRLLAALRKVTLDEQHVFFADQPGQKPVWDFAAQTFVKVPVANSEILEKMKENLVARKERADAGRMLMQRSASDIAATSPEAVSKAKAAVAEAESLGAAAATSAVQTTDKAGALAAKARAAKEAAQ